MADPKPASDAVKVTPEQRKAVLNLFTRAKQFISKGNHDYAIELMVDCCKRDPGNIIVRQELRKTEKAKYKDNKKGKPFAFLSTWGSSVKMETAYKTSKYTSAIEAAENVFLSNPWHVRSHVIQALAFDKLGLKDLALWTLDQARQVDPNNATVNRQMALLFEERGTFTQAISLWRLVAKKLPKDKEATKKATSLAASETISRGKYEDAVAGGPTPIVKEKREVKPGTDPDAPQDANSLAEERVGKDAAMYLKRIEETPKNANTYHHLAQLYRRHDLPDKARETLQKGLAAAGQNFELSLELMDLDIDPFRRDQVAIEQKIGEEPKNEDLKAKQAKLFKEINTRELAMFRAKSDRFPTDTVARYEMAVRLYHAAQYDEAIQEFQKVRTDPKHRIRVLIHIGFCFTARNNWRLAQKNFEEAKQNLSHAEEPFRKELMYQLAVGYAGSGEVPRAIELGCELANLDYSYKNISTLIEQWQTKSKR